MADTPKFKHQDFYDALKGESERGKAIILAAHIEDHLAQILKRYFKPVRKGKDGKKTEQLFGVMRRFPPAFASFGAAGACPGLLSGHPYRDLGTAFRWKEWEEWD